MPKIREADRKLQEFQSPFLIIFGLRRNNSVNTRVEEGFFDEYHVWVPLGVGTANN